MSTQPTATNPNLWPKVLREFRGTLLPGAVKAGGLTWPVWVPARSGNSVLWSGQIPEDSNCRLDIAKDLTVNTFPLESEITGENKRNTTVVMKSAV
jgi:hypothetical protein